MVLLRVMPIANASSASSCTAAPSARAFSPVVLFPGAATCTHKSWPVAACPGAQGVSALIKERMIAKATQPDNNDRLMLLFPEVRGGGGGRGERCTLRYRVATGASLLQSRLRLLVPADRERHSATCQIYEVQCGDCMQGEGTRR